MEMNINEIVASVNNVNFFQFNWANQRDSAGRLERVLGEFLGQLDINSEVISNDNYDSEGNVFPALRISPNYEEEACGPSTQLYMLEGTGIILLIADYTFVYFLPNGTCVVDQREQSNNWDIGTGGFFATQPGTAFARVMAHGFVPEPVQSYTTINDEVITDFMWYLEDCVAVHQVELVANGSNAVYIDEPAIVPTIYAN